MKPSNQKDEEKKKQAQKITSSFHKALLHKVFPYQRSPKAHKKNQPLLYICF